MTSAGRGWGRPDRGALFQGAELGEGTRNPVLGSLEAELVIEGAQLGVMARISDRSSPRAEDGRLWSPLLLYGGAAGNTIADRAHQGSARLGLRGCAILCGEGVLLLHGWSINSGRMWLCSQWRPHCFPQKTRR